MSARWIEYGASYQLVVRHKGTGMSLHQHVLTVEAYRTKQVDLEQWKAKLGLACHQLHTGLPLETGPVQAGSFEALGEWFLRNLEDCQRVVIKLVGEGMQIEVSR